MKKVFTLFVIVLTIVFISACSNKPILKVYMPGDYIDKTLVRDFEKEFGVRVRLITFESNEIAVTQIQTNSYDLVLPSDYAIEELVSKNLLREIDYSKFDSFTFDDFDEGMVSLLGLITADGFDLPKYAVPYFWGNVGILYDTTKITQSYLNQNGWNALADKTKDVLIYDSSRDSFMIALKAVYGTNVNINQPTDLELAAAETWLINAKGPKTRFLTDEIFDDMLHPAKHQMAVAYSGDANYLMSLNDKLGYFVPEVGTNVFIDAFAIPVDSKEVDLAYAFINYFLSYEVALPNAIEIGYTSPRSDVIEYIIENEEYDASSYVVLVSENDDVFRYNTSLKRKIEEAWVRVRAS
jgi:spermidine/putrescine transport system substrate-binding protein